MSDSKKYVNYLVAGFLILVQVVLGGIYMYYLFAPLHTTYPLVFKRKLLNSIQYSEEASGLNYDPRYFSLILFMIFFTITSIGTIHLLYNNKKYKRITIGTYIATAVLIGVLFTGSKLNSDFSFLYSIAEDIKSILLSPVLLLILIAMFTANNKLAQ